MFESCNVIELSRTLPKSGNDWPMFGRNSAHTSDVAIDLASLKKIWEYDVGAGFGDFSPTIQGGVVFVGNLRGEVELIDVTMGEKLGSESFGGAIFGSPVIAGVSRMIVTCSRCDKSILSYDFYDGKRDWARNVGDVEAPPVLFKGDVYLTSIEGFLYRISADNGEIREQIKLESGSRVSPTLKDSLCIVATDAGYLECFNINTGKLSWKFFAGSAIWSTPSVYDTVIFAGTNGGKLMALNVDGRLCYNFDTEGKIVSTPVSDGTYVLFGDIDKNFYCLDYHTGNLVWKVETGAPITASPVLTNSNVIFGSEDRYLYVLEKKTGKVVQKIFVGGRVRTAPAVYGDYLVVGVEDSKLFGFKMEK
ncbi:MAG: PQQ-binding-like beta-propeller repeat protein [Candidatus Kryptoniota bacterium]